MMEKYKPFYDLDSRYPIEYFPLAEEEKILDRYWESIRLYICDYMTRFITGEEDIDENWDNYIKGFSRLGLEDVLNALQARYDRFQSIQ
jgi:hypothetical protein